MLVVNPHSKIIEADNHVLETYRTCEEKYRLVLHEHWTPVERAAELAFGSAMHKARETYKKALMLPETLVKYKLAGDLSVEIQNSINAGLGVWNKEMPAEMKTEVKADDKRSQQNFIRLARGYLEKYGGFDFKPVRVEVPGKRLLGTTPNGWTMYYVYTIDEVVEHRGQLWPLEFKTASGFGPPDARWFAQFSNKASVTGYIWATEQELDCKIGGAIIHAMWVHGEPKTTSKSKYKLEDYFKMDYTYRDDDQIEEWKRNTLLTGDDIVRSVLENRWKRADGIPCNIYNGCSMKQICEATPLIRERLLEINYQKHEWNPWERLED